MIVASLYFYACAALGLAGALGVVLSKNPIRSALGLLLLILSVAGLFLALHAQFLAAIQLIVYAGAIVVLFLFVIMLLGPSATAPSDNRGATARIFGGGLFGLAALAAIWKVVGHAVEAHRTMPIPVPDDGFGGIDAFGTVLFNDALSPFELSSALLMVAVVGAIAVARGRQGYATLSRSEQEAARMAAPREPGLPARPHIKDTSGVFRHDIQVAEESSGASGASGVKEGAS
jgi:NADH-quinone oxidoreductase subunit J